MIWYVCFLLALGLLFLAGVAAFIRRLGKLRFLFSMVGCALAAYVIYIPPYFLQYNFFSALIGNLIHTLQLISLDADYLDYHDFVEQSLSTELEVDVYCLGLGAVHVLLPVVFAMTAVALVLRCLSYLQMFRMKHRKRPIFVFSQINERSEMLARDLRSKDRRSDMLFLAPRRASNDYAELRRDLNCMVMDWNIGGLNQLFAKRSVSYYCLSDDEEANLNDALALLRDAPDNMPEKKAIFLRSSDPTAELLLDSVEKQMEIQIINEELMAVYHLLDRYPLPCYGKDGKISVLITGFTRAAQEALRTVAWMGQVWGFQLSITLLAKDKENEISDFETAYPNLFSGKYDFHCFSYKTEQQFAALVATHCGDANYVMVCDGEKEVVSRAVALRRLLYRLDGTFTNAPPIFAYVANPTKTEVVSLLQEVDPYARAHSYEITPFGRIDELYTVEHLPGSYLEALAKSTNLVYSDVYSSGDLDVGLALQQYNAMNEVSKKSNRANAMHIRYKLLSLGLDYTDDPEAEAVLLEDYLTPDVLDGLARAEHDRWQVFLESEGWKTPTIEEAIAYRASGISKGRHQCQLLKLHPDLCSYDEIAERCKALGRNDSTVYDAILVSRIQDMLSDRWHVTGKEYKIIKRKD